MAGDWNLTPSELLDTSWLDLVGGTLVAPHNAEFTCRVGMRVLDFGVADRATHAIMLGAYLDDEVPWGPHLGAGFLLHKHPRQVMIRTAIAPPHARLIRI